VIFLESLDCGIANCTLYNTVLNPSLGGAPLYFQFFGSSRPNTVSLTDTQGGQIPSTYNTQNCIIVEEKSQLYAKIKAGSDQYNKNAGQFRDNIYYSPLGNMQVLNLNSNSTYGFGNEGFGSSSKQIDPQIDGQGRSALSQCTGRGVQ
jgi:hypothetical protein